MMIDRIKGESQLRHPMIDLVPKSKKRNVKTLVENERYICAYGDNESMFQVKGANINSVLIYAGIYDTLEQAQESRRTLLMPQLVADKIRNFCYSAITIERFMVTFDKVYCTDFIKQFRKRISGTIEELNAYKRERLLAGESPNSLKIYFDKAREIDPLVEFDEKKLISETTKEIIEGLTNENN